MSILNELLNIAKHRGVGQSDLAKACHISPEALSRMKKRGSSSTQILESIASKLGVSIQIAGGQGHTCAAPKRPCMASFREKYATKLAWSNQDPSNELLIRKALLNPQIQMLVDAAYEFGYQSVLDQWHLLLAEQDCDTPRVRPITERILRHIADGIELATR